MNYGDVEVARNEAEQTIRRADLLVRQTAKLAAGRLRLALVSPYVLKELKRELRDYNIHTGCWRDK